MNCNCVAFRLSICCSTELTGRVCASPLNTYTSILMRLRIVAILYARTYTTIFMQYFDTFPLNVSVTLALVIEKSVCVHAWAMGIRAKRHTYSQLLL